jgi:hypothetical protein
MAAEIIEFDAGEEAYTPEISCSFCGIPKSKAFGGFLVNGLEANICAVCVDKIRKALNPEKGEVVAIEEIPDGAA